MRIIKIGTDIAEKYLENIPSFSQAATYIFRKFKKTSQWIPIPNKLQSLTYKSPLGNVCREDYSEHPTRKKGQSQDYPVSLKLLR